MIRLLIACALLTLPAVAEQPFELTTKAWTALGAKEWDKVDALADQAERTWGAQARKENKQLTTYPKGDKAKAVAVLNELATITFIKGEARRKKGDKEGAIEAYNTLITDYNFGQCWDTKGWWWQPAPVAKDQVAKLAPETVKAVELKTDPLPERLRLPGKKGICFAYNLANGKDVSAHNLPRVTGVRPYWNYSWGLHRIAKQPEDISFLPMTWGAWGEAGLRNSLEKQLQPQIDAGTAKVLLGFNEPDKGDQANMTVAAALKYWPLLEATGLPLCSPACANPLSDHDDSTQGVRGTWMRDFVQEADKRGYRMDYIGVHWYGSPSPNSFKERMVEVYKAYGERPLIISEFAVADWGATSRETNQYNPDEVLAFMKDVLPWMERQNWIAGYAWFSFEHGDRVGWPSSLYDKDQNLTACGKFYRSVTTENPGGHEP